MIWLQTLASRLGAVFGRRKDEQELGEELRFHLEMQIEENVRQGMPKEEARAAARKSFGGLEQVKEEYRDRRGFPVIEALLQDVRFGLRALAKSPGFTFAVILTLGLGLGANTAIFSVVNNVFFRPLPFAEDQELVRLLDYAVAPNGEHRLFSSSGLNFATLRDENRVFVDVVAQANRGVNLTGGELPERVTAVSVTPNWSRTLGVDPFIGRTFTAQEDAQGAGSRVALISHSLWERRFEADPEVVGQVASLDGGSYSIVGVLPRGFHYPFEADLWIPATIDPTDGREHFLNVVARLKPGITPQVADEDVGRIAASLKAQYPENANVGISTMSLRENLYGVNGDERIPVMLLVVVGFFLLIACTNVANLMLARSVGRQKEIAVRTALGAGRSRQVRQLLTESLMLSLMGGVTGLIALFWLRGYLNTLLPVILGDQLGSGDGGLDARVLGFALVLAVLTGVVFGLVPALRSLQWNLRDMLADTARSGASKRDRRVLGTLVVSELALALILLTGAAMMIQNFDRLRQSDVGFDADNVLTMQFSLSAERYTDPVRRMSAIRELTASVERVPGVAHAGVTSANPFCCGNFGIRMVVEGLPSNEADGTFTVHNRYISPALHEAMGIPLLQGRFLDERDDVDGPRTLVIDDRMAARFWPDDDPLGKRLHPAFMEAGSWFTVVGVVGQVEDSGDHGETLYQSIYTDPFGSAGNLHLMVQADSDPSSLIQPIQAAVRRVDSGLALFRANTMAAVHAEGLSEEQTGSIILICLASFGLLLAGLGIYGVMSYTIGQQKRDFGIVIALGASSSDVLASVMRRGMKLSISGVALGLAGALAMNRIVPGAMVDVQPVGWVTLLEVAILLSFVGLVACYVPARRAMRVDPMITLRAD